MAVKKTSQKKSAPKGAVKKKAAKTSAAKSAAKSSVRAGAAAKKKAAKKLVKKVMAAPVKPKGPIRQRASFRLNEYVVYPAHGVGQIIEIKEQQVSDLSMEFFVINFKQERLVLKVPVSKVIAVRMRKLADEKLLNSGLAVLKQPARIKRTMWSRRAQEYESKINSGDFVLLCEVVRDLYRSELQREQSYSERQLYEAAFGRLQREVALARKIDDDAAAEDLLSVLVAARRAEAHSIEMREIKMRAAEARSNAAQSTAARSTAARNADLKS